MTNSHNGASKTGCFSSVLRHFLCAGGLPTHPSPDTDNPNEEAPPSRTRSTVPAGVVARLMGLDFFPTSPKATTTIMQKSRSLGSLDLLPNFQITKQPFYQNPHYRRTRTSVSFREVPPAFLDDLVKSNMGSLTPIQEKSKSLRERANKKRQSQSQSQRKKVKNAEQVSYVKIRKKRGVNGVKKNVVVDDGFRNKRYNHTLPKSGKHERKEKKKSMVKRTESVKLVLEEVWRLTMADIQGTDTKVVDDLQQVISYEIAQLILQILLYEMVDDLSST